METQKQAQIDNTGSLLQKMITAMRLYGPGIVLVLTMMGAGDLITSSVSGANYGYSLMWLLAGSLLIRYVIVNVMARFQLFNTSGMTILQGYAKIHKVFPYFFAVAAFVCGHLIVAVMIKGSGETLSVMFNFGSPFLWSVVVLLVSFFILGRDVYNKLEIVMKVLLAVLTLSFLGLAVYSVPDVGAMLIGTIGFGMPENTGAYGTLLVGISLVGAVAGSMTNLIYPYFLQDKGWVTPSHKRIQRNDLLFSFSVAIVINLSVWVVGAEILRPNGIQVETIDDISKALSIHLGAFGAWVFYLGVFGILYSTVIGTANGYAKVITDCIYKIKDLSFDKNHKIEDDKIFKWFSLLLLVTPIIWSIPGATGFVALTIFVNALNVVGLPAIAIGLLIISNKRSYLGSYTNNWFENAVLALTTILTIWSAYELLIGFFS
ncbi:Nramp family divalent metal transporter [Paenibacillus xerothermodurans]|uniref:Mn2+/Fe2+ transporter n=1 Tax=Paenibacillus xerothermodurans TaxID=1977292 RepID=A0A2W1NK63_PAEXE|nr:Nramp family divalent metal transporter [Paenibacillus xerothermodurans]PZE19835.1 Mn2+/Fe2+ transporter [Paenibacillus xerothermodurans]